MAKVKSASRTFEGEKQGRCNKHSCEGKIQNIIFVKGFTNQSFDKAGLINVTENKQILSHLKRFGRHKLEFAFNPFPAYGISMNMSSPFDETKFENKAPR